MSLYREGGEDAEDEIHVRGGWIGRDEESGRRGFEDSLASTCEAAYSSRRPFPYALRLLMGRSRLFAPRLEFSCHITY